jgi:uncharacterized membrane protein
VVFGLMLIGVGISHFVLTPFFTRIVPPMLPAPRLLVWVSGIAEVLLGVGLLLPITRRYAALGSIALLLAVYPANIYMALAWQQFTDIVPSLWFHLVRLPLQFVMIGVAYWIYTGD